MVMHKPVMLCFQSEFRADSVYTEAESGYGGDSLAAPEIVIDPPSTAGADAEDDLVAAIAEEMKQIEIEDKLEDEEARDRAAVQAPGEMRSGCLFPI